ncbi:MAG: clan AA aspartic protease [Gammaproteobacteria bacterium]|nr:clan AA aspartic protease [Gammaproteobacteria bacterium]
MNRSLITGFYVFVIVTVGAGAADATEFAAVVPLHGGNAYYVSARIGNTADTGDLMLDTGSGYVTINERTLARLQQDGDAPYVKDVSGILADGSRKSVPVYRVGSISIGCCCVVQDVEAAVFPGVTRQILGMSALKKVAPFAVAIDPPNLSLSKCRSDVSTNTEVDLKSF